MEGTITDLISKLGSNPEELKNIINPELIDKAKEIFNSGKINEIVKNLGKNGIDINSMKQTLQGEIANIKAYERKNAVMKQVVIITSGRKLKLKEIDMKNMKENLSSIIGDKNLVELSCSRMAQGPLEKRKITMWYSERPANKNRRASKIMGMPIMGDVVFMIEGEKIKGEDFEEAEKNLV